MTTHGQAMLGSQPHSASQTVTLNLDALVEHARCPICMGIIKDTRTVAACMHRFCKACIEAWLRSQKENNCPQCRAPFSSRRDCKPDPRFDQLLIAIFGDLTAFDTAVLEPSEETMQRAKQIGLAILRDAGKQKKAAPPLPRAPSLPRPSTASPTDNPSPSNHNHHMNMTTNNNNNTSNTNNKRPAGVGPGNENRHGSNGSGFKKARGASASTVRSDSIVSWSTDNGKDEDEEESDGSDLTRNVVSRQGTAAAVAGPNSAEGPERHSIYKLFKGVQATSGNKWQAFHRLQYHLSLPLGTFSSPRVAAAVVDIHSLRKGRVEPGTKLYKKNLNYPHLMETYLDLLVQDVARRLVDGTAEVYEREESWISAAIAQVPEPVDWVPWKHRQPSGGGEGGGPNNNNNNNNNSDARQTRQLQKQYSNDDEDSDSSNLFRDPTPEVDEVRKEQQRLADEREKAARKAAAKRAFELERQHPTSRAFTDMAGIQVGVTHVTLESGPGSLVWEYSHMLLPVVYTVQQLQTALGQALSAQRAKAGFETITNTKIQVYLTVCNELDAAVDFDAVCAMSTEVESGLVLREHVSLRDLMLLLADCNEDLVLEYTALLKPAQEISLEDLEKDDGKESLKVLSELALL